MPRPNLNPADFGIALGRTELIDQFVRDFIAYGGGRWTIDELVLNPNDAMRFCDFVRKSNGYYELPDNVILRALMNKRKATPGWDKPGASTGDAHGQQELFGDAS